MSRVLAEYGKTKYVSLIFLIYHICVSSPLFHFSLSQSAYTWWFDSDEASHDGAAGAAPLHQSSTNLPSSTRARRAGRRSRRARRARASAGSASRAELGKDKSWCKRHALKRGFGSGEASHNGAAGASSCEDLSSAHPKFFPFPIPLTGIRIQRMI